LRNDKNVRSNAAKKGRGIRSGDKVQRMGRPWIALDSIEI
jgi:hypothetical protein